LKDPRIDSEEANAEVSYVLTPVDSIVDVACVRADVG
jgi:hypothetical protein